MVDLKMQQRIRKWIIISCFFVSGLFALIFFRLVPDDSLMYAAIAIISFVAAINIDNGKFPNG